MTYKEMTEMTEAAEHPDPRDHQGRSSSSCVPISRPITSRISRSSFREGFYDGIVFHRVIDGFMAQTGCPDGTGTGGSKYPDLKAEFNAEPHVRGTCSMARAQHPDSANSQFFICFDDATLPRPAIYGLGRSDLRHGECR